MKKWLRRAYFLTALSSGHKKLLTSAIDNSIFYIFLYDIQKMKLQTPTIFIRLLPFKCIMRVHMDAISTEHTCLKLQIIFENWTSNLYVRSETSHGMHSFTINFHFVFFYLWNNIFSSLLQFSFIVFPSLSQIKKRRNEENLNCFQWVNEGCFWMKNPIYIDRSTYCLRKLVMRGRMYTRKSWWVRIASRRINIPVWLYTPCESTIPFHSNENCYGFWVYYSHMLFNEFSHTEVTKNWKCKEERERERKKMETKDTMFQKQ